MPDGQGAVHLRVRRVDCKVRRLIDRAEPIIGEIELEAAVIGGGGGSGRRGLGTTLLGALDSLLTRLAWQLECLHLQGKWCA